MPLSSFQMCLLDMKICCLLGSLHLSLKAKVVNLNFCKSKLFLLFFFIIISPMQFPCRLSFSLTASSNACTIYIGLSLSFFYAFIYNLCFYTNHFFPKSIIRNITQNFFFLLFPIFFIYIFYINPMIPTSSLLFSLVFTTFLDMSPF